MEQGTLGELYLTRSVTKHIRKNNKAVVIGAGVGKDYSMVRTADDRLLLSEGMGETPLVAWVKALNNMATSGGGVAGVRVCYMLPEGTEEIMLKEYAATFNALADSQGIQIIGGNTRVSSAYLRPSFLVEVIGSISGDNILPFKAKPDYQVVMVGYTGVLGTNLIVDSLYDELRKRFAASYVAGCKFSEEEYYIAPKVNEIKKCIPDYGIVYIHDISQGGVYGALWQLGVALNMGVEAEHKSIPVRQETIEICNYFDINPYMLDGTGAFLVVAKEGELVADRLRQLGYMASVIGRLTENKDRVVVLNSENRANNEKRYLAPVKGDEIYKVIAAY